MTKEPKAFAVAFVEAMDHLEAAKDALIRCLDVTNPDLNRERKPVFDAVYELMTTIEGMTKSYKQARKAARKLKLLPKN